MATEADILAFLVRFRQTAATHGLFIWSTGKNNDWLLETGFTNDDVESVVKGLTPRDYSSGPQPDDDATRPIGEVWKFQREYEGYELYVKLKLRHGMPVAECVSCHEAESEMRQPHRRTRR